MSDDQTKAAPAVASSFLFAPVPGLVYRIICDGIGLGKDHGVNITVSTSGNLIKCAEVNPRLHDAP